MMRRNLLIGFTIVFLAVTTPFISSASVVQGLSDPKPLAPGTKTVNTYTLKPGDTLWALARQFGITVSDLMSENQIRNPRSLHVGQQLSYTTWTQGNGTPINVQSSNASTSGQASIQTVSRSVNPLSGHQGMPYTKVLYCTLTAYSPGPQSTGKQPGDKGYGITSTGQTAQQGVTVAVDPNVIPYGTKLFIPGIGYRVAEDTGGAIVGDHIDIFYNQRSSAVRFGVKYHEKVYLLPSWYHLPLS